MKKKDRKSAANAVAEKRKVKKIKELQAADLIKTVTYTRQRKHT